MLNPLPSTGSSFAETSETQPETTAFGAHLQHFTTRVNELCEHVACHQLSGLEAHEQIQNLFAHLRQSYQETLGS